MVFRLKQPNWHLKTISPLWTKMGILSLEFTTGGTTKIISCLERKLKKIMLNKVLFDGRLTRDCELVETREGKKYLKFDLAVNTKDDTFFLSCLGDYSRFDKIDDLKKGDRVIIDGVLLVKKKEQYTNLNVWLNDVHKLFTRKETEKGE